MRQVNNKKIFLGKFKNYSVWEILTSYGTSPTIWKSYFIVTKNGNTKRIHSKKQKKSIVSYFFDSINFITLKLIGNCNVISFVGSKDDFYFWEAWNEDSTTIEESIFIIYNLKKYKILTDKTKIEELKAYLLLKKYTEYSFSS